MRMKLDKMSWKYKGIYIYYWPVVCYDGWISRFELYYGCDFVLLIGVLLCIFVWIWRLLIGECIWIVCTASRWWLNYESELCLLTFIAIQHFHKELFELWTDCQMTVSSIWSIARANQKLINNYVCLNRIRIRTSNNYAS